MKEVEVKVRIVDTEAQALIAKLDKTTSGRRDFNKVDEYFKKDEFIVRCRKDGNKTYVTYKNRVVTNNTEVNDENEMEVSDGDMFINILKMSGLAHFYSKVKNGFSCKLDGFTLDFSKVNDIGYFLEIERLVPDEAVSDTIIAIKEIMKTLNLSEDDIDTRPYSKLILGEL